MIIRSVQTWKQNGFKFYMRSMRSKYFERWLLLKLKRHLKSQRINNKEIIYDHYKQAMATQRETNG